MNIGKCEQDNTINSFDPKNCASLYFLNCYNK